MTRKTETIDRATFNAMLATLAVRDADAAQHVRECLESYDGGETAQTIIVDTDSLGHLDSLSSPAPTSDAWPAG